MEAIYLHIYMAQQLRVYAACDLSLVPSTHFTSICDCISRTPLIPSLVWPNATVLAHTYPIPVHIINKQKRFRSTVIIVKGPYRPPRLFAGFLHSQTGCPYKGGLTQCSAEPRGEARTSLSLAGHLASKQRHALTVTSNFCSYLLVHGVELPWNPRSMIRRNPAKARQG